MIRDSVSLLSPAVHSTRKRRSASRGPDSWFAGGGSLSAATDRAGHGVARAAPSNTATAKAGDLHRFIGISPLLRCPAPRCTVTTAASARPEGSRPSFPQEREGKRETPGAAVSEIREPSALTR